MIVDNLDKVIEFSDVFERVRDTDEIKTVKNEIEKFIVKKVNNLESVRGIPKNLFSVESRIKSVDSFKEKIFRKNYITKWNIKNKDEIEDKILKELPDLIGVRVNCYFFEYEEPIYLELKSKEADLDSSGLYTFNFNEKIEQENGHKLYKFTGRYNDKYNFEIQIKSVMHNLWGEVEHKTVYKNREYNNLIDRKKTTTLALWEILQASDKQLRDLYEGDVTTEQLLRGIFYNFTKEDIKKAYQTDILAKHYKNFFDLFIERNDNPKEITEAIKEFVIKKLMNDEYKKKKKEKIYNEQFSKYVEIVLERCNQYNLEIVYSISQQLFDFDSYNDFIAFLLISIGFGNISEEEDEFLDDSFDYGEEIDITDSLDEVMNDIISYLDEKLKGVVEIAEIK